MKIPPQSYTQNSPGIPRPDPRSSFIIFNAYISFKHDSCQNIILSKYFDTMMEKQSAVLTGCSVEQDGSLFDALPRG